MENNQLKTGVNFLLSIFSSGKIMTVKSKFSGKKILTALLLLFLIAVVSIGLVFLDVGWAVIGVYFSVPLGALLTMAAAIGVNMGLIEKDF
jgi:hypothetical protein